MKQGVSTLNPYAASYIPLSKREASEKIEFPGVTAKVSQGGNQTVWYGSAEHATLNRQHDQASSIPQISVLKSHSAHGFSGSSSQNPNEMTEKQMMDEEFDMDLEYLQMTFPGISDESLNDVYMANQGDLEATIDMLKELEFDPFEFPENLPDTLDIGDVSESGSPAECSSVKLKNVVGEASASSSGSSTSESVTVT
ncbi:hypothetical protein JCGZ_13206 [Jatropha curcas]|uniref:CUE domain-containing protein n=1 Tax=Jatropha curcas TaxID=180498 RepID=A0A067K7T8_JATCU|nr:polyadenylate-binding protein-interacting protein 6 [Jatropha curcas]XP_012078613.1 polyadenylate-binding protein-interacting protein 6 [Jatropha curcas]KDP32281.1 hypothetical protein JCGZ_13206 [Jatropha curcas]